MEMETTKKDLEYYRKNAEGDYLTTPISVLRYIAEMEQTLRIHDAVVRSEQLVCDCGNPNLTWYGNDDDKTYFCFECKKEVIKNK